MSSQSIFRRFHPLTLLTASLLVLSGQVATGDLLNDWCQVAEIVRIPHPYGTGFFCIYQTQDCTQPGNPVGPPMSVICNQLCHCEDGFCELGPGNELLKSGGSAAAKIPPTTVYDDVLVKPDGTATDSRSRVLVTTGVAVPPFPLEATLPDKFTAPQTEVSLVPEGQDATWKVLCQGVIRIQEGPGSAGFDYFAVYRAYPAKKENGEPNDGSLDSPADVYFGLQIADPDPKQLEDRGIVPTPVSLGVLTTIGGGLGVSHDIAARVAAPAPSAPGSGLRLQKYYHIYGARVTP